MAANSSFCVSALLVSAFAFVATSVNGQQLSGFYNLAEVGNSLPGIVFFGADADDNTGYDVSSAGDVNGDGLDDIIISGALDYIGGELFAGGAYLIYGSSTLNGSFNLANADVTFQGISTGDYAGRAVSAAGDVNGDGFGDLLIAAPGADGNSGDVYLVYGGNLSNHFHLSNADAVFQGPAQSNAGHSVASAGDVNGDGKSDILIGAYTYDPGSAYATGEAYLVYGGALSGATSLADADVIFRGLAGGDQTGYSVASAGDVNGDHKDDLLIGAPGAENLLGDNAAGRTYLVYGGNLVGELSLVGADAKFFGIDAGDYAGQAVSSAGDINGDGLADLLIAATEIGPTGGSQTSPNEVYLLLGGDLPILSLADDTFFSTNVNERFGSSIASAGDVNGDGFDDFLVGAYLASRNEVVEAGTAYLLYGGGSDGVYDYAAFGGSGDFNYAGWSVAPAGDFNGDGLADFLIGAWGASDFAGETYLIFGQSNSVPADFNLDGQVDAADYVLWRKNNGTVSQYALWRANYGRTEFESSTGNTVPEPSAASWILIAFVMQVRWRRRSSIQQP